MPQSDHDNASLPDDSLWKTQLQQINETALEDIAAEDEVTRQFEELREALDVSRGSDSPARELAFGADDTSLYYVVAIGKEVRLYRYLEPRVQGRNNMLEDQPSALWLCVASRNDLQDYLSYAHYGELPLEAVFPGLGLLRKS